MTKVYNFAQMFHLQPALIVRRVGKSLLAGMMSVCLYAAGPAVVEAQNLPENLVSSDKSGDLSERYHPASMSFAPCAENPHLECGRLTLPVDYSKPSGDKFDLAVARARATKPHQRIGVLLALPGGPGLSGVDFLLGAGNSPTLIRLLERFDVVSFDPRGAGRSRPVSCEFEGENFPADPSDEALAAFFDNFGRRFARACLTQNGNFIKSLGTNNVARDMDALRRALGEEQISYVGISYATVLGAVYSSLFPQRVRAMVLDGGVAPEFEDYFVESWSEFSTGFERAFQRLDQLCRRDPACRLQTPSVVAVFDEVAARLKAAPVTSPEGVVLSNNELADIISALLSGEENWPLIVDALAEARGADYSILFQVLSLIPPSNDAVFPFFCNDYGTRRPASEYLPVDEAVGALNPRFFGRFFVASATARCTAWPKAEAPLIQNVKNRVSTPILLVGNDFDPNTHLAGTRSLAHALGMDRTIIRYQGGGHTAVGVSACIDDAVVAYLLNLTVPAEGFSCPAQPIGFGPPATQHAITAGRTASEVNRQSFWGPRPPRIRKLHQ